MKFNLTTALILLAGALLVTGKLRLPSFLSPRTALAAGPAVATGPAGAPLVQQTFIFLDPLPGQPGQSIGGLLPASVQNVNLSFDQRRDEPQPLLIGTPEAAPTTVTVGDRLIPIGAAPPPPGHNRPGAGGGLGGRGGADNPDPDVCAQPHRDPRARDPDHGVL